MKEWASYFFVAPEGTNMDQCIKFKGKLECYNYRRALIITFLESFVLNLAIFGEENLQCLIFFTLCLLLLLYLPLRILHLCGFRSAKLSGFMLDDDAQKIITEKGMIIPYNKVKEIYIVKQIGSLAVLARLGTFTQHVILDTGNIKKDSRKVVIRSLR